MNLEALLDAKSRIEGGERLDRISDTAVGSGVVKQHIASQHVRSLERHGREARSASPEELSSIGIKVVRDG